MKKVKYILMLFLAAGTLLLCACGADNDIGELVLQDSFSPNEEYVTDDSKLVYYNIDVYQNSDNVITVRAYKGEDNSAAAEYRVIAPGTLSEDDFFVEWLTADGQYEATENNQYQIAEISLSQDGNVYSDCKVDFSDCSVETVLDNSEDEEE